MESKKSLIFVCLTWMSHECVWQMPFVASRNGPTAYVPVLRSIDINFLRRFEREDGGNYQLDFPALCLVHRVVSARGYIVDDLKQETTLVVPFA